MSRIDLPGFFKMSKTLPSFKTFAGLKGPSYSFSFLLLMLLTAVHEKKTFKSFILKPSTGLSTQTLLEQVGAG